MKPHLDEKQAVRRYVVQQILLLVFMILLIGIGLLDLLIH